MNGQLLQPSDDGYDQARRIYNAMIDRRPRLIARCADAADVMAAVDFARESGMEVSIKGGGHGVAGLAVAEGGLMIDLSGMRGIRVDPEARTVRVEGGCRWRDVDHATHAFGLATPAGVVATTGVAGLTLGGGFGHLSRRYGLTCDNLISADVVTADGGFVTANAQSHPDLFWALRGGSGNFGAVVSFEFRLHAVNNVYGGMIAFPIEAAGDVLRFYREFIARAPEDISVFFGFHLAPPAPFIPEPVQGLPVAVLFVCYCGDQADGEEAVKPIREFAKPALDLLGPMPYPVLQGFFDELVPPGLHHYWKSDFVGEIRDEAISVHASYGPKVPAVQSTMHIYPLSGAVDRVRNEDTAFGHREAQFAQVIVGASPDAEPMPGIIEWVRNYWSDAHPYSSGATYVNFLMEEGADRAKAAYGGNYARLAEIKARYDPANLFHLNQNIRPAV